MANTKKYVSLDKLGLYDEKIKGVIAAGDAAALQSAKDYADGLAANYDVAGAAATAEGNAKTYTNEQIASVNGTVAGVKTIAEQGVADAATADGKAVAAQGAVDALSDYVGTIPEGATATDIVGYVQEKTSGIATEGAMTELGNRVGVVEGEVATIKGDYLKGSDKTELEGKITAVEGAVATEKSRAEGIEAGLASRIKAVEDDYLKAADKDALQDSIDTVSEALERLTNGVSADEIDGVNDLINYVKEHGPEVTGMQGDIADNASAIADVAGRVDTLEGEMDDVQGAVATKAEKTYVDEQIQALQGADTGLGNRIAALEGKFGGADGSVEDMIADAKQAAIDAAAADAAAKDEALETKITTAYKAYADAEDAKIEARVDALEGASATHALKSEVEAVAGRVTTAEGKISTLEGKMTAVEGLAAANKVAHEANAAAIALKADATALTAVSDRVGALETWHSNFVECSQEDINGLFD